MQKPAPTDYPIHELLRDRWSPRAFKRESVDEQTMLTLLEAARWAPSSYNEQPWAFVIARRDETSAFERLLSCLVEFNQSWAKDAGALMIGVSKKNFDKTGQPNRHGGHDLGAALAHLTVQAESMGLRVHQMAGVELEKARATLGVPEGWDVMTGVAIGRPGELAQLPEDLREREIAPRSRKPLNDFVHRGLWGNKG